MQSHYMRIRGWQPSWPFCSNCKQNLSCFKKRMATSKKKTNPKTVKSKLLIEWIFPQNICQLSIAEQSLQRLNNLYPNNRCNRGYQNIMIKQHVTMTACELQLLEIIRSRKLGCPHAAEILNVGRKLEFFSFNFRARRCRTVFLNLHSVSSDQFN